MFGVGVHASGGPLGPPSKLAEVAWVFLRLGTIAFGGPAAHIAMMEDEVVHRRAWITREEFLDRLGAASLIPGPSSTEMTIYLGYQRAGWPGLIVAGTCFILPAALIVTAIAWAYVRFENLPHLAGAFYGLKPVVIAIVGHALWKFAHTAIKNRLLAILAIASLFAIAAGIGALAVLVAAGSVSGFRECAKPGSHRRVALPVLAVLSTLVVVTQVVPPNWTPHQTGTLGLTPLFLYFVKIGSILYGSGYVLLAFLEQDLVGSMHWLTSRQLLDAIAIGQVTPGPVFTTATFIGYILLGAPGGFVATVGIFLPAFIFCAISGPVIPRIRSSQTAGAFLDGVNVASLSLMAAVTFQLGRTALVDGFTVGLAIISAIVLIRYRINSGWLAVTGALLGLAYTWLRPLS